MLWMIVFYAFSVSHSLSQSFTGVTMITLWLITLPKKCFQKYKLKAQMSVFVIVRSFTITSMTITDFTLNFVFHKFIDYLSDFISSFCLFVCLFALFFTYLSIASLLWTVCPCLYMFAMLPKIFCSLGQFKKDLGTFQNVGPNLHQIQCAIN